MAAEMGAVCLDQYNNLDNLRAHYESTAPEIWEQTNGNIHALVLAPGTGGTLAGCSKFLKEKDPNIHVTMIDIQGSLHFLKLNTPIFYSIRL
jgi:cysteine synthase